jgi:hypothetical protein
MLILAVILTLHVGFLPHTEHGVAKRVISGEVPLPDLQSSFRPWSPKFNRTSLPQPRMSLGPRRHVIAEFGIARARSGILSATGSGCHEL